MSALSNLFDDALIGSMAEGIKCNCVATVLMVDDNEFNLVPLSLILKSQHKIQSIKALDGEQAVKIFRKDRMKRCCNVRIQIVLMDIVMPVMDGLEATARIMDILREERAVAGTYDTLKDRAQPAKMAAEMGVYIAAVTAYIDQPSVDKMFDCGMVEAIPKPVNSVLMAQLIKKYYKFSK